jgi:hypothetical protein
MTSDKHEKCLIAIIGVMRLLPFFLVVRREDRLLGQT